MDGSSTGAGLRRPPSVHPRLENRIAMTNQPVQRKDLRLTMPKTAKWVDERRAEYGAAFVNDCLKRAIGGEPGLFYALEGGQVTGTPFPWDSALGEWQAQAIVAGLTFAAFMAQPATRDRCRPPDPTAAGQEKLGPSGETPSTGRNDREVALGSGQ
jgi:hypothetical protein